MKKVLFSLVAMLLLSVSGIAQTTYTKITSASGLEAGTMYIIVGHDDNLGDYAMSYQKNSNRHAVSVTVDNGSITVTPANDPNSQTEVHQVMLGGSDGAWTFFDPLKEGYLYAASSSSNQLKTQTTNNANGEWAIEFNEDGTAVVTAQGENTRNIMRFNENSSNGDPLFNCYNSGSSINVPVSLYKSGTVNPDPEPTNYPTEFEAFVDGVDVYVLWEDATGGQLPYKYLVLASTGNITVPTDGTPVPDSDLAKNVPHLDGSNGVVFSGLQNNTTYHFAIFPYTNSGANIDYKTNGTYPTATATTESVEVLLFEDFNDTLGVFTPYNSYGEQEWHYGTYQGTTYANMNGYADGAPHQNEDWLISPTINIPVDAYEQLEFEFRTAKKFEGPDLQVLVSLDYDGQGEPGEYTWFDITDAFDFSTGNYEWVESGTLVIDYDELVPGHYHFAFLYTSTDEAAASWEIDYVKLIGKTLVSVNENNAQTVSIYPNPAREQVSFNLDSDAQVIVFDVTGRMVSEMNAAAGNAQLNVSELVNGVYFVNFRYANGSTAVSKFVKF